MSAEDSANRLPSRVRPTRVPINVGMVGLGNVGSGVVRWFQEGRGEELGINLRRVAVADPNKPRVRPVNGLTADLKDIQRDTDIDIVVEVMGGQNPAKNLMLDSLISGRGVVTANKAVVAEHKSELFQAAQDGNSDFRFEAAVGGGIPIIDTIINYRGVDRIRKVVGIVNGTTNFILTRMASGMDFDTALSLAQKAGFAEQDHIADTGGHDAAAKLAILASLAFNSDVKPSDIQTKGILGITILDMHNANRFGTDSGREGYAVKLLAIAERSANGALYLDVRPRLVNKQNPLAAISDEVNAITLESDFAGPQTFIGKGAGSDPTASSVVRDIVRIARNLREDRRDELPTLDTPKFLVKPDEVVVRIRTHLMDEPGSMEELTGIYAEHV